MGHEVHLNLKTTSEKSLFEDFEGSAMNSVPLCPCWVLVQCGSPLLPPPPITDNLLSIPYAKLVFQERSSGSIHAKRICGC